MRTASLVHIGGWGKRDGALPHIFFQNPGNPTVLFQEPCFTFTVTRCISVNSGEGTK